MQDFAAYRKTVRTASGEVAYVDVGEGPVALFVHGVITGAYLWRNVIDGVQGERRCIAIDLPLHGESPAGPDQDFSLPALAELVEEVCAALELGAVDLVGNDTGGAICQIFAARHPERIRTFTLTNTDVQDQTPTPGLQQLEQVVASGQFVPLALQALEGDLRLARTSVLGPGYEDPAAVSDETIGTFLTPVVGDEARARTLERFLKTMDLDASLKSVEPQLRQLTAPTLIVWGTGDTFFETRAAYWLRDTIPGAVGVVEVPGAKLFFPDERPGDLVPHLLRHWAAHPAVAASA
jgi:pimeloyl-ACP methyl ester carboxylesterase